LNLAFGDIILYKRGLIGIFELALRQRFSRPFGTMPLSESGF